MEVPAWLPRAAAARPDHPAINDLSYAELFERARRAASAFAPGERVRIALEPSEDLAVVLHACLLRGAVAVPARDGLESVPDGPALDGPFAHDLDATAIFVHTSGTTSEPKPVELTFGNWLWSAL